MEKIRSNPGVMTSEAQLERLCAREKWVNPYEVLLLGPDSTDEEIRSKFRKISVLVHPDKCRDDRALHAFHILESAYKTLQDPEKKKTFQRIMREARERVEYERKKENCRRDMLGLAKLPEDTFSSEVQDMCNRIFREIEERKIHFDKYDFMAHKRQREEDERRKEEDERKTQDEKEWERSRDKRVNQWRTFTNKKDNKKSKKRMRGFEMKPPVVRMEERKS
ncbi:DNAJC8 [Blepharisma stoltei]|uniref:J domain-containing protein n=1 Tax=Blepharisma stoltei TaxID=1481888 RepID=A0AAU9JZ01_9CILI|nr:unnamed protein product [Blepharisma stoltei]